MNIKKISAALLWLLLAAPSLYSHGTKYEIINSGKIGVKAMYETGDAMSGANVLVFPPGSSASAASIRTDKNGVFYFTPDAPGTWIFQVRDTSGHGMRINLQIDESLSVKGGDQPGSGLNIIQKVIMALSIVWGAIGTAFYFKGKKS
jgi:hypothetical protein